MCLVDPDAPTRGPCHCGRETEMQGDLSRRCGITGHLHRDGIKAGNADDDS